MYLYVMWKYCAQQYNESREWPFQKIHSYEAFYCPGSLVMVMKASIYYIYNIIYTYIHIWWQYRLSSKCNKVIHTDKERIDIVVMKKGERNDESPWESLHVVVVVYIQNTQYTQNACTHEYVWQEEEECRECVRKRASRVVYFADLLATRRWPALREIMQLSHCCYRATASL